LLIKTITDYIEVEKYIDDNYTLLINLNLLHLLSRVYLLLDASAWKVNQSTETLKSDP